MVYRALVAGWRSSLGALALLVAASLASAQNKIVAYVPVWVDLPAFTGSIDYGKITHINLAFENPLNETGEMSFQPKNELLIAQARKHRVKVLVSIAGGSVSSDQVLQRRYFDLIGPARRAGFVAQLAEYVARHELDGLDVDLEGPAINQDYGPFVRELAAALKTRGKLVTAALSRGYGGARVPDDALQLLDFVNVMAYDGAGPWKPDVPGQHSSMEFARGDLKYWQQRGLAKEKIILGVPFYGYGFGEAFRKRAYSYAAIVSTYPGSEHADQAGNTIWYNGIPTIQAKSAFVRDEGFGGMMIWSLDQDAKDGRSLLDAMYAALTAHWVTRSLPRQP